MTDCGPGYSARRARADAAAEGSGIGLRLCRLLAQRAGGALDLVRDDPGGTEFVLRLPAEPA